MPGARSGPAKNRVTSEGPPPPRKEVRDSTTQIVNAARARGTRDPNATRARGSSIPPARAPTRRRRRGARMALSDSDGSGERLESWGRARRPRGEAGEAPWPSARRGPARERRRHRAGPAERESRARPRAARQYRRHPGPHDPCNERREIVRAVGDTRGEAANSVRRAARQPSVDASNRNRCGELCVVVPPEIDDGAGAGARNAGAGRDVRVWSFDPDGTRAHETHATTGSNRATPTARPAKALARREAPLATKATGRRLWTSSGQ